MQFSRCFQCMEEIQRYPCPRCGYDPGAESAFPYALQPGTILNGKYVVGTVLGQGGFGITYIGWDLALESKVAIKEYFPSAQVSRTQTSGALQWYNTEAGRTARDSGREMFLKEARKMARTKDIPQVVRVLDLFQQNNTAYIVMDFVEGETLKNRLKKAGPLPWEQAKDIFLPAIEAMERIHKAGLVHRDLSPDNLMLTPDGSVRILDLGAAKDLNINTGASSMQVAKGGFSPMEQYVQSGGSGPWTDVYAMAATIYFTLTGVLPLPSVDRLAEDTLRWDLPQLAALPENVLTALQRAMAISPKARTQSMAEFASQLIAPVTAPPRQPERKARSDESTKTETAPEPKVAPKKEPTAKGKDVPGDTTASKGPEHSGGSSGKARKRLLIIAAIFALLVVLGRILILYTKKAPAGPTASENIAIDDSATVNEELATESEEPTTESEEPTTESEEPTTESEEPTTESEEPLQTPILLFNGSAPKHHSIALASYIAVAIKTDGTVVAAHEDGQGISLSSLSSWEDIVSVSACDNVIIGVKADGTVVACGADSSNKAKIESWDHIVQADCGGIQRLGTELTHLPHFVGLKSDGTVVAEGNNQEGQCEVGGWSDIIQISAGSNHTVGLRENGTVVAAGDNSYGQCDVSDWTDIVSVAASSLYTYGVKSDGSVVFAGGRNIASENIQPSGLPNENTIKSWKNIVEIYPGFELGAACEFVFALTADETVLCSGGVRENILADYDNIVDIAGASWGFTMCLLSDGTVITGAGWRQSEPYQSYRLNLGWTDIQTPIL